MRRLAVVALSFAIAAATLLAAQDARPGGAALPGVLISRQLAEDLGIQLGESIKLSAESTGGNPREFRVDGIYEPTPDPMRINASKHEARLHLPDLESLAADPKDPFSVGRDQRRADRSGRGAVVRA
jgi:hypothetical protein